MRNILEETRLIGAASVTGTQRRNNVKSTGSAIKRSLMVVLLFNKSLMLGEWEGLAFCCLNLVEMESQ